MVEEPEPVDVKTRRFATQGTLSESPQLKTGGRFAYRNGQPECTLDEAIPVMWHLVLKWTETLRLRAVQPQAFFVEETERPLVGFLLEVVVVSVLAILLGRDPGIPVGVSAVLTLDFLGLRRALQRRRRRLEFERREAPDLLCSVDQLDFTRDWLSDVVSGGLYAFGFFMVYPTAVALFKVGGTALAWPVAAAATVAALPPVMLAWEGLVRAIRRVHAFRVESARTKEQLPGGSPAPGMKMVSEEGELSL